MSLAKCLPITLLAIHIGIFGLTEFSGLNTVSHGNPFVWVATPFSLPLIAQNDTGTVVTIGLLATLWWYFIGLIGSSSARGKLSRTGSALGTALILFFCVIDAVGMFSELRSIRRDTQLTVADDLIYILATTLLAGGVISAGYSATNALGFRRN